MCDPLYDEFYSPLRIHVDGPYCQILELKVKSNSSCSKQFWSYLINPFFSSLLRHLMQQNVKECTFPKIKYLYIIYLRIKTQNKLIDKISHCFFFLSLKKTLTHYQENYISERGGIVNNDSYFNYIYSSAQNVFILQKKAIRLIYGVSSITHCQPFFFRSFWCFNAVNVCIGLSLIC